MIDEKLVAQIFRGLEISAMANFTETGYVKGITGYYRDESAWRVANERAVTFGTIAEIFETISKENKDV